MKSILKGLQRDLPKDYKDALDALERIAWPHSSADEEDMMQFLYVEGSQVLAHVGVLFRQTTLEGEVLLAAGICGVITHPDHRKNGYAKLLLEEAVSFMKEQAADFSICTCEPALVSFYETAGWSHVQNQLLGGTNRNPMRSGDYGLCTMLRRLSAAASQNKALSEMDIRIELGEHKLW